MKTFTIIPSGGSGSRTSFSTPKQYLKFGDKELIAYTMQTFQECDLIDEIILAAQPDFFSLLESIKIKYSITKITGIVEAGNDRQNSVFNALKSIEADRQDIILVHDAARPLLPKKVLENAVNSAKIFDSIVVALKARDTLIKGHEMVDSYVNREEMFYAQTPQAFRYDILMEAMKKADNDNFVGTDESMLVKMASHDVHIVEGSPFNFKITNDEDIKLFEHFINGL